jgi:UV-stimulated scaffold protein A
VLDIQPPKSFRKRFKAYFPFSLDVASTSKDTKNGKWVVGGVSHIGKAPVSANGTRNLDPEKSKLLAEAPVLPWSSVLDRWGSSGDVHVNQRGLEVESH